MKAPDAGAALAWGVRNLRVSAEHITVRPLPDANPPNLGHNTPMIMSKKKTTKKAEKPAAPAPNAPVKKKATLGARVEKLAGKKAAAEGRAEGRRIAERAMATGRPSDGMSGLDAAAHVLKLNSPSPLTAKEIIGEIERRELAPTLKGKTPHATIYAAMITEIAKKGEQARFERGSEKGTFTYHEPKPAKA